MLKLRIKEVAEEKNIKQSRLQRESGVTMPTLRRYWTNDTESIHLVSIEKIAKALGVRVCDLLVESSEAADTDNPNHMVTVLAQAQERTITSLKEQLAAAQAKIMEQQEQS